MEAFKEFSKQYKNKVIVGFKGSFLVSITDANKNSN